ncbi:MAG TPA: putative sugar nucleotidyl transferase [Gemmatimonadaceae bacterium]|nr:putative sugar nucleotidyl transferase [Gemmatimonadaceae bacterium]
MSGFVLYDDVTARQAEPFALTRPFGELRAGALLLRDRWARALGMHPTGFIGADHLSAFTEFGSPRARTRGRLPRGTVVVNARFAPALASAGGTPVALQPGDSLRAAGAIVAVRLAEATPLSAFAHGATDLSSLARTGRRSIRGWWIGAAWDLVRLLPEMLADDLAVLAAEVPGEPPAHVTVLGEHRLAVERGAHLEPFVVVDTTGGDVVVRAGARIAAFTRIAGPCIIGEGTIVAGGRFACCAIGEHSRVCGEMSVATVAGHANKAHDGFVGHSIIGRWVNLGAGTTTSNLKNSYGSVRVENRRGPHDTGLQFLGALVGDHAKTAIGTRLTTGTTIGAGANVFGDRAPARYVPPFAWGDRPPFERYELDKFLDVAAHVMGRRSVKLPSGLRRALAEAWRASGGHQSRPARRGSDAASRVPRRAR